MATIRKTIRISAPLDRVWAQATDVGNVSELVAGLAASRLEGDLRTCTTHDGQSLSERIITNDAALRRVVYTVTSSPWNFEFHSSAWDFEADGDETVLTWETDIKPDGLAAPLEAYIDSEVANIARGLAS